MGHCVAQAERRRNLKHAIEADWAALQAKDFASVVSALDPVQDEPDDVASAKLAYARRKTGQQRCKPNRRIRLN